MPINIVFTAPGNYTIEDDGIRGNNISVIRDGSGAIVQTFSHPSDALSFSTITPGVNLTFNVADSFGSADVSVGVLGDLAASPDSIVVRAIHTNGFLTLVSRTTITEGGSDASADAVAAAIVFSAVSGVGSASNAFEMQTTFLEAETDTGGINLANFGQVQIGGITPDVAGLSVASSGNITFATVGPIFLSDTSGEASVHGGDVSGNVTLTALGALADIYAPINFPSIYARGGGITLDAGRDVLLGPGGSEYNNDVLATGDIRITAGGDFRLDGRTDIRTGAFVVPGPGGDIFITTGGNINLENTTGGFQTIQAFAGDIVFTTGPGGAFIENAAFPGAVSTTNDIILNTDNVEIFSGGLNTSGIGAVTIRPVTPGLFIDLGSTAILFPGTLAISDAEFDLLYTLNVVVGSVDSGNVTFSAPLSPFIVDNLTVNSGNDILFNSSLSLPRALTLRAGDDVYFALGASFTSANEGLILFVDRAGDDGNLGGTGSLNGTVTAPAIRLNGNIDNDTLIGTTIDDVIRGAGGADAMTGKTGDDIYYVDDAGDAVTEAVGEGTDQVRASIDYTLAAEVENLILGGGARVGTGNTLDNTMFGAGGADTLSGLLGHDILRGNNARDELLGGGGQDLLDGGQGKDTMTGGAGQDDFQFRDGDFGGTRAVADVITDFDQGANERMLLNLVDANTVAGGNQAFTFIGSGAFTGVAGQLHYVHAGGNTYVEGDLDGDSVADIFIRLDGLHNLVAGDFLL